MRNRRIQSRVSEPCHGRPDISASGEAGAPIQNKVCTEDYIEGEPPISDKMMIGVLEFKDKSQKKEYIYRDEYGIYKVNYDASGKEINRLYFSPDIKIVRYRECK